MGQHIADKYGDLHHARLQAAAQFDDANKVPSDTVAEGQYGIKPSRRDLIVTLSQRLFKARAHFNNLSVMAVPADTDYAMKMRIEYDLARAEMYQVEHDLNKATQPV